MSQKIEKEVTTLAEMFSDLDLVRASLRFNELRRDINRLITEYLDKGYPKNTTLSSDFSKVGEAVPPLYQSFAVKFLANEFPKLQRTFLIAKLREYNFHIYPVFRFIFKKYALCDCVLHPEDEDGNEIYGLANEVKNNYTPIGSQKSDISADEFNAAARAYPLLHDEMRHISKKRESYLAKTAAVKTLINERSKILDLYAEEKRRYLGRDIPNPLVECPVCMNHYLKVEIIFCSESHLNCRYCLREDLITNYLARGASNVICMSQGCKATYATEMIRTALGAKKFQQLEEAIMFNELGFLTKEPNVYTCQFCPYRFSSKVKPEVFCCQNSKCPKAFVAMCLLCNNVVTTHTDGKCPTLKKMEDESLDFAMRILEEQRRSEAERRRHMNIQAEDDEAMARRIFEEERNNAARAEEMRREEARKQQRRAAEEEARRKRLQAEEAARQAEYNERHRREWEESLRAYVVKKMDEAVICECPDCKKRITKDKGCNHVRCVCGCNFCYQCRRRCEEQENPSNHFGPKKCEQFLDQKIMDDRLKAAARMEAEAEWKTKHPEAAHVKLRL